MAYPFQLPELGYAHDALEPHIDARTMEIHHGKHHAGLHQQAQRRARADHAELHGQVRRGACLPTWSSLAGGDPRGGPQQRWRLRQPHPLLGRDDARVAPDAPSGDLGAGDRRGVRLASTKLQGEVRRGRRRAAGSARDGAGSCVNDGGGLSRSCLDARTRIRPLMRGQDADPRRRRLGARLLPPLPEPSARLPVGVLERGELGQGRRALRRGPRLTPRVDP